MIHVKLKDWRDELTSDINSLKNQIGSLNGIAYNTVMAIIQEKEKTLKKINKILAD